MSDTESKNGKSWLDRNWKWFLPLLGSAAIILFLGSMALFVYGLSRSLKSTDVYQMSINKCLSHRETQQKLGKPVKPGWYVLGGIKVEESVETAKLVIPLHGFRSAGNLHAGLIKVEGIWQFDYLLLWVEKNDETINLLEREYP